MPRLVTLRLDSNDVGQILEGLDCRCEPWKRTAEFLQIGDADGGIEGCCSTKELIGIAAFCARIIAEIQSQAEE